MSLCEGICCTALINVLGLEKFCLLHCTDGPDACKTVEKLE